MRDKQHQKNPTNADLTRKGTTELKRYKKYITPYLSAFVIGPLMMLTEVAGEVMLPKFMSMIINNGVADRNLAYIGKMGALMVLTVLFMAVLLHHSLLLCICINPVSVLFFRLNLLLYSQPDVR